MSFKNELLRKAHKLQNGGRLPLKDLKIAKSSLRIVSFNKIIISYGNNFAVKSFRSASTITKWYRLQPTERSLTESLFFRLQAYQDKDSVASMLFYLKQVSLETIISDNHSRALLHSP